MKFSISNKENGDDYYKPLQDFMLTINDQTITSHDKLLRATTNKFNAYNSYNDHDNGNVTPYLPKGIIITTSLIGILHNRI